MHHALHVLGAPWVVKHVGPLNTPMVVNHWMH